MMPILDVYLFLVILYEPQSTFCKSWVKRNLVVGDVSLPIYYRAFEKVIVFQWFFSFLVQPVTAWAILDEFITTHLQLLFKHIFHITSKFSWKI